MDRALRDLQDTLKCTSGVPEGEETEKQAERIFEEIMAEYVQNLTKNINLHN